jgi:hypothetical protein
MSSEAIPAPPEPPLASRWTVRAVSACGVASLCLLAAALAFAHHWGALTDTIVAGWAGSTAASALGVWFLGYRRALRGGSWAAFRIAGAAVLAAVAVLVFAGVVWATGGDPAGYCGGG